jgi:hypothetical protein
MARDALPPPPLVHGTPARYDARTFARSWDEQRAAWTAPAVRVPLVRSRTVHEGAGAAVHASAFPVPCAAARTWLVHARLHGWRTRTTYALGWEIDASTGAEATDIVWEETGEFTDEGKSRRRKVSETLRDPVHSFLVRAGRAEFFVAGLWVSGRWNGGYTRVGSLTGGTGEGLHWHANQKTVKAFIDEVNSIGAGTLDLPESRLPGDDGE